MASQEYNGHRVFTHSQPDHISPAELSSLLTHVGNLHPTQFIMSMSHHYNADTNMTLIEVITTANKYPGQFDGRSRVDA